MSGHAEFDEGASSRTYTAPYSSQHPVPTVQGYQEKRQDRSKDTADVVQKESTSVGPTREGGALEAAKERLLHRSESGDDRSMDRQSYGSQNRNQAETERRGSWHENTSSGTLQENPPHHVGGDDDGTPINDTSEAIATSNDPRQKRKNLKALKRDNEGRRVTDPVTHLSVVIHDSTESELKSVPEGEAATGHGDDVKRIDQDDEGQQNAHSGMEALYPPPNLQASGKQFAAVFKTAVGAGLSFLLVISLVSLLLVHWYYARLQPTMGREHSHPSMFPLLPSSFLLFIVASLGILMIWVLRSWVERKILAVWEDGIWQAARAHEQETSESSIPESVQWLNSFLASVWPLINPDLFTSLADTLEDVMQASLPKMVRMISVEDLGQGNEALRILGVKWLPIGNARKDVSVDGQVQKKSQAQESDRKVPNEGQLEQTDDQESDPASTDAEKPNEQQAVAEGMEAEEGDFVNVEVGLSYRATSTGKSMKVKAKNAHLYLVFYLPGGIRFPVWVELRGMVGTTRMRLQLCPDPPFVALCTLTFLGQPKVDLSCVPLTRKGLNIMDLPLISSFVQSSIDAALAEYVAPKSLTVDLKDMLVGDDFKKDTSARGVLVVRIRSASGFKEGDQSFGGLKQGSSDAYVAVGWAKFGKPVWSTRIIKGDMKPVWNETSFILVSPEELNAAERLRVQLWDSDRASADDDLGRIEVDLKDLMSNSQSASQMWHREDRFKALSPSETMPGRLTWSVGYFAKERIQEEQLEQQSLEPDVKSLQQLKDKVARDVGRKMREASSHDETPEISQQKAQELKIREDNMIVSTRPLEGSPSGILSIQIHHISGLQLEKINKSGDDENFADDTAEGQGWDYGTIEITGCSSSLDDLPSSLHDLRLKLRTAISRGKMYSQGTADGQLRWKGKKDQVVHLAVQQRYRSCLIVEFRKNRLGLDKTPAFAILWLQDIPDEEEYTSSLAIYGGDNANLKRAGSNCDCDLGEQIGSIAISTKFWRGLSRYHKHLASSNPGVQDVLEVLGTAEDSKEVTASLADDDERDDSDSSSTSSDSEQSSGEKNDLGKKIKDVLRVKSTSGGSDEEGKEKNPLKQLKDYSDHSDQLHQHHRGLMQWKVRTDTHPYILLQD
ncbi:MAG: hypothetical protein Q9218_001825 [Villophora microphyllina]